MHPSKLPFDCCIGGHAEAQAAYEEAVDACYNLKLDSHRHAIPRISSKTGEHKWSMMEMWPMTVSSQLETLRVALQAKLPSQSCQTATRTQFSTRLVQDLKSIQTLPAIQAEVVVLVTAAVHISSVMCISACCLAAVGYTLQLVLNSTNRKGFSVGWP